MCAFLISFLFLYAGGCGGSTASSGGNSSINSILSSNYNIVEYQIIHRQKFIPGSSYIDNSGKLCYSTYDGKSKTVKHYHIKYKNKKTNNKSKKIIDKISIDKSFKNKDYSIKWNNETIIRAIIALVFTIIILWIIVDLIIINIRFRPGECYYGDEYYPINQKYKYYQDKDGDIYGKYCIGYILIFPIYHWHKKYDARFAFQTIFETKTSMDKYYFKNCSTNKEKLIRIE